MYLLLWVSSDKMDRYVVGVIMVEGEHYCILITEIKKTFYLENEVFTLYGMELFILYTTFSIILIL